VQDAKLDSALAFALATATGMSIGIGVLRKFNGNDPSRIVAFGTLDALSAGVLLWVGLVGMWAHDWMFGELMRSRWVKKLVAFVSLVVRMLLMGILGVITVRKFGEQRTWVS